MTIVGGLDVHRQQITFDYLDTDTGEVSVGQIPAADRRQLAAWCPVPPELIPPQVADLRGSDVVARSRHDRLPKDLIRRRLSRTSCRSS
jgi:hypothetical protein